MSGIAITFPGSSAEGQSYLAQNGFTYIYDSQKNRWKRGGDFVRAPKVLSYAGIAATTTGSGITTGPTGSLIYVIPGTVNPSSDVGVDSYKAYRYTDSYPNHTEIQVSISSAFSSIAYAATSTSTTFTIPASTLSGDQTYYLRARQFVGSNASAAGVGAISGYSANPVKFTTASVFLDTPTIVSIAGTSTFPVYQIGFAGTTLPATVTYTGSGVGNLEKVEWRVTGPRNPDSTGDTALAEVGIGTLSSVTLANSLVLAMPFSGAAGVGITNDVNNAIRTASGASAGTTKTVTAVGGIGTASVGIATTTAHFYPSAAYFDGSNDVLTISTTTDFSMSSSSFTLEAWIYPTSTSGERGIFSFYDSNGNQKSYILGIKDSTIWWLRSDNGTSTTSSQVGSIYSNSWYHLALCKSGTITNIFLNGILVSSIGNDYSSLYSSSTTFDIGIGDRNTSGGVKFIGYIQDAKVYKGLAKYTESFTPPLPTYGTISYTTSTIGSVGIATTAFLKSTGDIPTAEASSTAANALVLAMPMNRTFGFQDINVAVRGLTSGASAGTAKTVGLGTTSTANAPTHPIISSTESKWYDGAAYFNKNDIDYVTVGSASDWVSFSNGTNFTFETWFYPTSTPGGGGGSNNQHVLFNTNGQASGSVIGTVIGIKGDGSIRVFITNTSSNIDFSTNVELVPIGSWTHIAVTQQSKIIRVFVNGVLQYTYDASAYSYSASNPQTQLYIGKLSDSYWIADGYFQDYKVYSGFQKYTANFTPPQPICGFTTDLAIQTGFTTTTATGSLLSSVVGLGSTSTLAFGADQTYSGITSITSSSGITTLPDTYAQNLVLALPLANITGVGNSFTNDRNTQIRTASITGAGVTAGATKTITNTGVTTSTSVTKYYGNSAFFNGSSQLNAGTSNDYLFGTGDFTIESWFYLTTNASRQDLCGNYSSASTGWGVALGDASSNGMYFYYGNTTYAATSAGLWSTNTWNHIALSRQSGTLSIYLNGNRVSSASATVDVSATSYNTLIGAVTDPSGNPQLRCNGYIQDIKIYKGTAKYTTNFTPPPPMFGDYVRSTPNKIVFTPGSDYVLEARNTATGGIVTSTYSATRQWGTKPKGGIYDPYASNLVLAIPGGAVGGATSTFDVTGQIRFETPTATYVNAGIVTYSNSLGIGTYGNKSITNTNVITSTLQSKYYGRSLYIGGNGGLNAGSSNDFIMGSNDYCIELWCYINATTADADLVDLRATDNGNNPILNYVADTSTVTMKNYGSSLTGTFAYQTWAHVALTKSRGILRMFINGIQTGQITDTRTNTEGTVGIGQPNFTTSYRSTAYINDLRIYKGVAKYTSNFTPPNQIYLT